MNTIVDARQKFQPSGLEYKVQIKVTVNLILLWTVIKCLCLNKDLRITHTFTNDPFLNPDNL